MIQIDMPMPYNCSECRFKTEYEFCKAKPDNFCGNTNDKVRPEWCPLKEREAKPPVHVHDEYPEHDWVRKENGEIDDFACSGGNHNGPFCKRCFYTFCIYCKPNGWNDQPCIVDKYNCPGCGKEVVKGTKFCHRCGQEMKWDG